MGTFLRKYWQAITRVGSTDSMETVSQVPGKTAQTRVQEVEIAPNDPLLAFLLSAPGPVEVEDLRIDSPALHALHEAGVKIAVPLISQGELIGLLNLGPRLSEQEYSTYDHSLLNNLATQAAPALRVAQLARQQQAEARERERLDHELRVARVIQETLLPKELPVLAGWQLAAYWQPARAVSGDFYDFIVFPDGKLGIVEGDVTDKGVPAALVMATTRSVLRSVAEQLVSPGKVLEHVNDMLCPDIPPNMFVTCLYAVLDPASGLLRFANAGHNLPCKHTADGMVELRATGMPLGLMPGMVYEEKEALLDCAESILIYSDGLVESHNPEGEMFGFPRLRQLVASHAGGAPLIDTLRHDLEDFTGLGWEQEDDVTFVTLERTEVVVKASTSTSQNEREPGDPEGQVLGEFTLASEPGNERQAVEEVADAVKGLGLSNTRLERLKTAVGEATMNAMEHGNHYRPDRPVQIKVVANSERLTVIITDHGGDQPIPDHTDPDLDAKLAGLQSPRGWGLFLIKNMVDELRVSADGKHHTVELIMTLKGTENDQGTI